jgi:hypothetical protein
MKACADARGQLLDRETADRGVVVQQHSSHPAGLILLRNRRSQDQDDIGPGAASVVVASKMPVASNRGKIAYSSTAKSQSMSFGTSELCAVAVSRRLVLDINVRCASAESPRAEMPAC